MMTLTYILVQALFQMVCIALPLLGLIWKMMERQRRSDIYIEELKDDIAQLLDERIDLSSRNQNLKKDIENLRLSYADIRRLCNRLEKEWQKATTEFND